MRGALRIAALGVAAAVVSGVSASGAELEAGKREAAFSGNITAFYRRSTSQYVGAAQNSTGVALGISFFF